MKPEETVISIRSTSVPWMLIGGGDRDNEALVRARNYDDDRQVSRHLKKK